MAFVPVPLITGKGPSLVLLAWLVAWTIGGGFAALVWFWMVAGKERVTFGAGSVVRRYEIFGVGRRYECDRSHVKNLRAAFTPHNPWDFASGIRMWGIGGGVISFDYGARTIRFGGALDDAEGRMIVQRILERYPIPTDGAA